jgi:hypothetical protein
MRRINMRLVRAEDHCSVIYKRNAEIVGIIQYKNSAPSEESIRAMAKRISHLYKNSIKDPKS